MIIFIVLLIMVIIFSPNKTIYSIERGFLGDFNLVNKIQIFIIFVSLVFVSGFRVSFIDTTTYRYMYERIGHNHQYMFEVGKDIGFSLYMILLNYLSSNSQFLIFISAIIVAAMVIHSVSKYSIDFRMSIFLYITMGFFAISMNIVAQFIAISIIFLAFPLLIEKKYIKMMFVIIFASLFHITAVSAFILFFLIQIKPYSKKSMLLLLPGIAFFLLFEKIFPLLLGNTRFYVDYSNEIFSGELGTSWLRILVECSPAFLGFLIYKLDKDYKRILNNSLYLKLLANASIISALFYILSWESRILARGALFFSIFNILFVPILINRFGKGRILVGYIVSILYLVYFVYQIYFVYGITAFPLQFNLF